MQNSLVQAAMTTVPAAIVFLLLGIGVKKVSIRSLLLGVAFMTEMSVMAVPQLISQFLERNAAKNYDPLGIVYAVAEEGSVDIAHTMLQDLRADYAPEYALAAARLAVQNNDYTIAKALYLKAIQSSPEAAAELEAVQAMCNAEAEYYSVTTESDISAINTARLETHSVTSKDISKAIQKSVPETADNAYGKLANYLVYAEKAHQEYLKGDGFDSAEAKKQLRKMNSFLEENPEFLNISQVRLARIKLQILSEAYQDIAEAMSENADYNELLIVSELYLNHYIKSSHFAGNSLNENIEKYQMVYDRLNEIYNDFFMDQSREERNTAKSQLRALKTAIKNPVLGKIEEGLSKYAAEKYALDASKAYIQMAKIEHSLGNETKSAEYIDRSIDTVGDCDDSEYTIPMYELIGIIQDKDNAERLKEAAKYVDQVLHNNLTIKMNSDPVAEEQAEDNDSDKDSLVGDFSAQMQTHVNQKRMSVNIVNVDTTDF
jgi:hypothetical protein